MTRIARIAMVAFALGGPAAAPFEAAADNAQVQLARAYYEKGDAAYSLGKFDEAAGWFAKSYDAWPATDLLFNIAQSHRRAGHCQPALITYRRYLSLKDQAEDAPLTARERVDIARFIREAIACAARASLPVRSASPSADANAAPGAPAAPRAPTSADDAVVSASASADQRISVYATGGTAWYLTRGAIDIPVQPSFAIGGHYALPAGPMIVQIGARGAFSPIQYDAMRTRQWASLAGAHATVGSAYAASRALSVRAELGAGLSRLGGLVAYNPFTVTRRAGSFTMPSLRIGFAAECAITPRLRAALPSIGLSWLLAPDDLAARSLGQLELQLGIDYRM